MKITTNTTLQKAFSIIKTTITELGNLVNSKPSIDDSSSAANTVYSSNKVNSVVSEVKAIYIELDLAVPTVTANAGADWARAYYADITVEGSTTNMTCDIIPDTAVTSVDDIGLLTLTDTISDNTVRLYFSAQPKGTYQIKAVQLIPCTPR